MYSKSQNLYEKWLFEYAVCNQNTPFFLGSFTQMTVLIETTKVCKRTEGKGLVLFTNGYTEIDFHGVSSSTDVPSCVSTAIASKLSGFGFRYG